MFGRACVVRACAHACVCGVCVYCACVSTCVMFSSFLKAIGLTIFIVVHYIIFDMVCVHVSSPESTTHQ